MKFRYDVFVAQTQHFVCNIRTAANIQVGDELQFTDRKDDEYSGKVVRRRLLGTFVHEGIGTNDDEIRLIQIDIEQEQPT